MSNDIVNAIKASFDRSYDLLGTFIDVCPDNIWNEVSGGWPVWQQLYHAAATIGFFAGAKGSAPAPFADDVAHLSVVSKETISKDALRAFAADYKAVGDAFFAKLSDADLTAPHPGMSALVGAPMPNATVAAMFGSHTMYHLGGGDAALRSHGLKGVF